jgi:hypothetical protein
MTTMVERGAAVIANFGEISMPEARIYMRRILEAMAEPSPAMWDAAQENALPPGWLSDWQSLISAALAEDEVTE